ncbi:MAG: GGDEF domain-containing protein [Treponema sp.]|nr:GGDEF domain-containing protein [Treponema sp.]
MTNDRKKKPTHLDDDTIDIFSHQKIMENYAFLQEIGVFDFVHSLEGEIKKFKRLLTSALDIFAHTSVDEIIDATVWQISDYSLPSAIVFIWKPLHNRDEISIKSYKNYQLVPSNLEVKSIDHFEPFFQKYPRPVNYDLFSFEFCQGEHSETLKSFDNINPELVIPIMGPSGLYGLVLMGNKIRGEEYSIAELSFIQHLMSFVSLAIQNNLHYERTLRDVKTGLYNNGFFLTRLGEEIARTKRNGSKASVIIIDIDFFKKVNDTFGHLAGDRVLETLAITIKQTIRTDDIPSRFGGEEFTVLLPDTDKHSAFVTAERLRDIVSKMKVTWEPPLPPITISIGICTFEKDSNLSTDEIIQRADEAMYWSKKRGRNRSTAWGIGLLDKIERKRSTGADD